MSGEVFGTMFKPNVRWACQCGTSNVTKLIVPIHPEEVVWCRNCHRRAVLTVDLSTIPTCWGGTKEMEPNAKSR